MCDREDSESYAKRTISEIETCLGFTFHGAGGAGEEDPDTITTAELEVRHPSVIRRMPESRQQMTCFLPSGGQPHTAVLQLGRWWSVLKHQSMDHLLLCLQTLNTQVEAALQSGLNFKDRFRTSSKKRLEVPANQELDQQAFEDTEGQQLQSPATRYYDDLSASSNAVSIEPSSTAVGKLDASWPLRVVGLGSQLEHPRDLEQQPVEQQEQPQQVQQQRQQQPPPVAKGPGKKLGGLQLAVGSQMETGEWKSNGTWLKKEKQDSEVPSNLQVIAADDLIKVSTCFVT